MRDLQPYYERELAFMQDMAGEFALQYPEAAGRLNLERHRCDDPHVARLIEAFCLISARIHRRLDEDFPEITQSLLNLVYPHYLRPVPSMSVVQFQLRDSERQRNDRVAIPSGTQIELGEKCLFRTTSPVHAWPITVVEASVVDATDIPIWARAPGLTAGVLMRLSASQPFSQLEDLQSLRLYLTGSNGVPHTLYELLLNNCSRVLIKDREQMRREPLRIAKHHIVPVGFASDEALLPYDGRSFVGLRLLHEYLALPEKFLFFDLQGLGLLRTAEIGRDIEIFFALDERTRRTPEFSAARLNVSRDNFLLGCTPVVNLFSHLAEQIRVDHTVYEHQIFPDGERAESFEVYSVDRVTGRDATNWQKKQYRPFFSFEHDGVKDGCNAFWHAVRRTSALGAGTEVFLSLVDPHFQPADAQDEILEVQLTCSNRDLPQHLDFNFSFEDLSLNDSRVEGRFLHRPTASQSPPVGRDLDWRVISMLGLNYLSLCGSPDDGASALRELLELYNFADSPIIHKQINSLRFSRGEPTRARVTMRRGMESVPVFCHGVGVDLELDADSFAGSSPYLFACVLEQFLAHYSSLNSFTKLTAHLTSSVPSRRTAWHWPAHSGERILL